MQLPHPPRSAGSYVGAKVPLPPSNNLDSLSGFTIDENSLPELDLSVDFDSYIRNLSTLHDPSAFERYYPLEGPVMEQINDMHIGLANTSSPMTFQQSAHPPHDPTFLNTSTSSSEHIVSTSHLSNSPLTPPSRTVIGTTNTIMTPCTPVTPLTSPAKADFSDADNCIVPATLDDNKYQHPPLTTDWQHQSTSSQYASDSDQGNLFGGMPLPSSQSWPCPSNNVQFPYNIAQGKKVRGIPHLPTQYWRGDPSSNSGITPYLTLEVCNHVPGTTEGNLGKRLPSGMKAYQMPKNALNQIRKHPQDHGCDTFTMFNNAAEAAQFFDTVHGPRSSRAFDRTLPRTDEEKRAIVKMLFKAIKSCSSAEGSESVQRPYLNQTHNNAKVELVCWDLLEATIHRSCGGPLSTGYIKGVTHNAEMPFSERMHQIMISLATTKSVPDHLFASSYINHLVDDPCYSRNRVYSNKGLNDGKAKKLKLASTVTPEDAKRMGMSPPSGRKRRKANTKAKVEIESDQEDDDDAYDYYEEDDTIYTLSPTSTPARTFATPRRPRPGQFNSETPPSPLVYTPTSSQGSTYAGTESTLGDSPMRSVYTQLPPMYRNPHTSVHQASEAMNRAVHNHEYPVFMPTRADSGGPSHLQNTGSQFDGVSFANQNFAMGNYVSSLPSNMATYSAARPNNPSGLRRQLQSPIQSPAFSVHNKDADEPPESEYF